MNLTHSLSPAIGLVLALLSFTAPSRGQDTGVPSLLFVQSADGMTYDAADGRLTLKGVSPAVTFFTDRPQRIAGHVLLDGFLQAWDEGEDSFKNDPPNAELSILAKGKVQSAVVVLSDPVVRVDQLSYAVKILDGELPASGGPCSLFIDGLFAGGALPSAGRGAALGAIGGAIAGDAGKGAAIGAAVGAAGGAMERRQQGQEAQAAQQQANETRVIKVQNSNGSFTPVTLQLCPDGWKGPKGEVYPTLPTEDQLRKSYGM